MIKDPASYRPTQERAMSGDVSKVEELTKLPLRECHRCGRLEFTKEPNPICATCTTEFVWELSPPDSVTEFEAIAQHFYRDTGYVRPGKDCRVHDWDTRQAAFDKWNKGEPTNDH